MPNRTDIKIKERIFEDLGRVPTYTYYQIEAKLRRRDFSSNRIRKLVAQELEPIALVNRRSDAQYERKAVNQLLKRLNEYKRWYWSTNQLAAQSGYSVQRVRQLILHDQSSTTPIIRVLKYPYVESTKYNREDFNKLLKAHKRYSGSKQPAEVFDLLQRVTVSTDQAESAPATKPSQQLTKPLEERTYRISGRVLLNNQNRRVVVLRNGEVLTIAQALKRKMVPELKKTNVVYNYGNWVGLDETVKIGEYRLFRDQKLIDFIDFLYERFSPLAYHAIRDGKHVYLTVKEGNSILNIEGMAFQAVKQMGEYLMQLCPTLTIEVEKRPEKNRVNFIVHSTKERITIGITPERFPELKEYAKRQGKSVNALASDIVNAWLKQKPDRRVPKQAQVIDALGPASEDSVVSGKRDDDLEDQEWEDSLYVK